MGFRVRRSGMVTRAMPAYVASSRPRGPDTFSEDCVRNRQSDQARRIYGASFDASTCCVFGAYMRMSPCACRYAPVHHTNRRQKGHSPARARRAQIRTRRVKVFCIELATWNGILVDIEI